MEFATVECLDEAVARLGVDMGDHSGKRPRAVLAPRL
jgi:hypothetical protein